MTQKGKTVPYTEGDRNTETASENKREDIRETYTEEDMAKNEGQSDRPLAEYSLMTEPYEGSYTVLNVNGYLYFFNLSMDAGETELLAPEEGKEELSGEERKVFYMIVSDGKSEEELGYISGFSFAPTSACYVEPKWQDGNKTCGRITACEEGKVLVQEAEAIDRDTYIEFTDIAEDITTYSLSPAVQYVIVDENFRNTSVTEERFRKYAESNADTFYYFTENNGVITQIWEPYIP